MLPESIVDKKYSYPVIFCIILPSYFPVIVPATTWKSNTWNTWPIALWEVDIDIDKGKVLHYVYNKM